MPDHRRVNSYTRQRSEFVGDAYEANVFGGSLKYKTDGIYLVSDNGSFVRLNRNGLFMRDADILLKNGSLNISGGNVAIYSAPNGLTSNTYMFMSNDGLSAFKGGVTSFFIDARTGNVSLAGIITASAGSIGTWQIYPNGLSASYSGYTMYLSPEYGINYNNNFIVDPSGNVTAFNAYLAGTIVAARGRIGTWDIYSNGLCSSVSSWQYSTISSFTGAMSSYTGSISSYNAYSSIYMRVSPEYGIDYNGRFSVDSSGNLTAYSALIKGSISADNGYLNNLLAIGTISGGLYWYDDTHYLNFFNNTLTSFNINNKFVVLTSGDVHLSNISATGYIASSCAYIGGWVVNDSSIYKQFPLSQGDVGIVTLSTSAQPSSSSFPSGRDVGLQVFNKGSSTSYFFDASFGLNLIETNNNCGVTPSSGYFGNYSITRNPNRMGIQISTGIGTTSAYTIFEISSLSTSISSAEWPNIKAIIAGWKITPFGFSSCSGNFQMISDPQSPRIDIGSSSAGLISFGSSSNNTFLFAGSSSNYTSFNNGNLSIVSTTITSDRISSISSAFFGGSITGQRFLLSSSSLSAPVNNYEFVCKSYVDERVSQISLTSLTGMAGSGSIGYYPNFSTTQTISNGYLYHGNNSYEGSVSVLTSPTIQIEAERIYVRQDAPIYGNEAVSKTYADSISGHWKKSATNIYAISDTVSVGLSGSLFKFATSGGDVAIADSMIVGSLSDPSNFLSSNSLVVCGSSEFFDIAHFSNSVSSGRHFVNSSSLTAPLFYNELATKSYVDSVSGAITISDLFDVSISSANQSNILSYNSSISSWQNVSINSVSAGILGSANTIAKFNSDGVGISQSSIGEVAGGSVTISNNLEVDGVISATEKFFDIPHPLFNDASIRLRHSVTETNRSEVHYSGKSKIQNGYCEVDLPKYFNVLSVRDSERIFITPIGRVTDLFFDRIDYDLCKLYFSTDTTTSCEFYWIIFTERISNFEEMVTMNKVNDSAKTKEER